MAAEAAAVAQSLSAAGFATGSDASTWTVRDPWNTRLRIASLA